MGTSAGGQVPGVHLAERVADHRQVMVVDPFREEGAWNFHLQGAVAQRQLLRRLEPGIEDLAVQLGLDLPQDFFPEIHEAFP
jgi:hypothetical protein